MLLGIDHSDEKSNGYRRLTQAAAGEEWMAQEGATPVMCDRGQWPRLNTANAETVIYEEKSLRKQCHAHSVWIHFIMSRRVWR